MTTLLYALESEWSEKNRADRVAAGEDADLIDIRGLDAERS